MANSHAYREALRKAVGEEKLLLALEHAAMVLRVLDDTEKRKLSDLDEKKVHATLDARFGEFLATPVKNMIAVAAASGEWSALADAVGATELRNKEALVTTSRPLTAEMETAFRKEIARNEDVREVRFAVDPTLIGGVKVRMGDREADYSVQSALQKFR